MCASGIVCQAGHLLIKTDLGKMGLTRVKISERFFVKCQNLQEFHNVFWISPSPEYKNYFLHTPAIYKFTSDLICPVPLPAGRGL